jgi:hypothetical protein
MKRLSQPLFALLRWYEKRYSLPHGKTCVVVLGMQRGGTSLVCDLLSTLGASFGDKKHHMQSDPRNPRGFYEDVRLKKILSNLMNEAGYSDAFSLGLPLRALGAVQKLLRFFSRAALVRTLHSIATAEDVPLWGVKSFPIFYYFLKPYLPKDRKVIAVFRHPFAVATSFQKAWEKSPIPFATVLEHWTRGMEDMLAFMAHEQNVLVVKYEYLLDEKMRERELDRLYACVGTGVREQLDAVIRASLNRSSETVEKLMRTYPLPERTSMVLAALDDLHRRSTQDGV